MHSKPAKELRDNLLMSFKQASGNIPIDATAILRKAGPIYHGIVMVFL